jgi:hypothetical protein
MAVVMISSPIISAHSSKLLFEVMMIEVHPPTRQGFAESDPRALPSILDEISCPFRAS